MPEPRSKTEIVLELKTTNPVNARKEFLHFLIMQGLDLNSQPGSRNYKTVMDGLEELAKAGYPRPNLVNFITVCCSEYLEIEKNRAKLYHESL